MLLMMMMQLKTNAWTMVVFHRMCIAEKQVLHGTAVIDTGLPYLAQIVKNLQCNAGGPGSVPGLGRSSGEGDHNPFQYSCLEDAMDRGDWWATVYGVTESRTPLNN